MLTNTDRMINAINNATIKNQHQGFQRRMSVTDLHAIEYTRTMTEANPAEFNIGISHDLDRISKYWFKVIVDEYVDPNGKSQDYAGSGQVTFDGDSNYTGGDITYSGHVLHKDTIQAILRSCATYGVLPSFAIVQLYVESYWGASSVGAKDNNWSGMTWTGNPNRPSGVKVTQGSPRAEGGYYMHYATLADFIKDWMYLLTSTGLYNVKGVKDFGTAVRGLFIEGGARANYAASGYASYNALCQSVRRGVNAACGNGLDKMDHQLTTPVKKTQEQGQKENEHKQEEANKQARTATRTAGVLKALAGKLGQTLGNGQCYGLVSWYSNSLGGAGLGAGYAFHGAIGDTYNAANIGSGYDWSRYGWKVAIPSEVKHLIPGSIYNVKANYGAPFYTGGAGHTGVIEANDGNTITVLEQNYAGVQSVQRHSYNAGAFLAGLSSVVYPKEIVEGKRVDGSGTNTGTVPDNELTKQFATNWKIEVDGIDFTPMFKKQYGGDFINNFAVFPNSNPNEGYDLMLAATALTKEQQLKVFCPGEHKVKISASMTANVSLRLYFKYSHLT